MCFFQNSHFAFRQVKQAFWVLGDAIHKYILLLCVFFLQWVIQFPRISCLSPARCAYSVLEFINQLKLRARLGILQKHQQKELQDHLYPQECEPPHFSFPLCLLQKAMGLSARVVFLDGLSTLRIMKLRVRRASC